MLWNEIKGRLGYSATGQASADQLVLESQS
jgi:hypothetical protein